MGNNRIQIDGVWYVKEDTLKKPIIEINPTHFEGYVVENDDFCFEATRIFKDDNTFYDGIDIERTDKRFENRGDWRLDNWDNDIWLKGILQNDPDSWELLNDMGKDENMVFLQAFLQFLTDKGWL
jgi:hypothetical protein